MKLIKTKIEGVVILEPRLFTDERGYFCVTHNKQQLDALLGHEITFVQDNQSRSKAGVVRGLHYQQHPYAQSKLVRVVRGKILDVAVDIRRGSPTFGHYVGVELSEDNHRQLFIPRGFAHGFAVCVLLNGLFGSLCLNYCAALNYDYPVGSEKVCSLPGGLLEVMFPLEVMSLR